MMKRNGAQLREVLDDPIDDARADQLWSGIAARRTRARYAGALQVTGALALAAATLFWVGEYGTTHRTTPQTTPRADGSLSLDNGDPVTVLEAPEQPRTVVFSDRSHIELARGARLAPGANTAAAFALQMHGGAATFDVTPGGARRWSIECGPVTVDVIGTRFEVVDEGNARVQVAVEHGIVLVRGEAVPGSVRRLVDGQSLEVNGALAKRDAGGIPAASSPSLAAITTPLPPTLPTPVSPRTSPPGETRQAAAWQTLAHDGSYDEAYRSLGVDGLVHESLHANVDDLLALADVARLSGHAGDAVPPLSRVIEEHGTDPRASLAAFTLGRIELDTLGRPDRAATAFARAIALGLPQGLVEDAYVRLVEARARAGNRGSAREAADDYTRRFPQGTRAPAIARWLGDD